MKKITFIILLLLAAASGGKAQSVIGTTGAGIFSHDDKRKHAEVKGDYEFAEARIMFGRKFRLGPMASYVRVGLKEDKADPFVYRSHVFGFGLSVDNWWNTEKANSYFWINSGVRLSYDHGSSNSYECWQDDRLFFFQGGFRSTRIFSDWFGNNLVTVEWQTPIKTGINRYSTTPGIVRKGKPYMKDNARLTYENGIKNIPFPIRLIDFYIEPTAHLGAGLAEPADRLFFEYGGGISVGYSRNDGWNRELFKIKAFRRQDLRGYDSKHDNGSIPPAMQVEIVINVLNYFKSN